jgi:hypothetical protein
LQPASAPIARRPARSPSPSTTGPLPGSVDISCAGSSTCASPSRWASSWSNVAPTRRGGPRSRRRGRSTVGVEDHLPGDVGLSVAVPDGDGERDAAVERGERDAPSPGCAQATSTGRQRHLAPSIHERPVDARSFGGPPGQLQVEPRRVAQHDRAPPSSGHARGMLRSVLLAQDATGPARRRPSAAARRGDPCPTRRRAG